MPDYKNEMTRILTVPIDGAAALRQILGILMDHDFDNGNDRVHELDTRLQIPWNEREWLVLQGKDKGVPLSKQDAKLLVDGLYFTEMMSIHLPFFDQVAALSSWIIGELEDLFPGVSNR